MLQETKAKIKEIIQRAYNVKSFRLEIPEFRSIDFKAGQFMSVELENNPELKRYLSISSSPTEKCYLEFTKKLTQSEFSKKLNALRAGDEVTVQYPMGKFTLDESFSKIAFLSGGIGITPIRSICKYAVDKNLKIDMVLIYSNRTVSDIVFKEDFDGMQKNFPLLKVAHVLCETQGVGFKCTPGLINSRVIKNEVTDYPERKFYLCGPPSMVEAIEKILREELGIEKEKIVLENFRGY